MQFLIDACLRPELATLARAQRFGGSTQVTSRPPTRRFAHPRVRMRRNGLRAAPTGLKTPFSEATSGIFSGVSVPSGVRINDETGRSARQGGNKMMCNRNRFAAIAAACIALVFGVPALGDGAAAVSGDAAHGAKVAYTCLGCHGIADYRNAAPNYHVPKIGGQHEAYLVSALAEYRAGARPHPTMKAQAGSMTAQEARDLAAYLATATPVASSGHATGALPAAATTCSACHGADGVGITADYPTLAGQHADYIEQALKAYRKGGRQNAIMNGMAAALTDADIHAIAAYYAGQTPSLWIPAATR